MKNGHCKAVDEGPPPIPKVDPLDVVGKTEKESEKWLVDSGFEMRVMKRDGETLYGTADYRPKRVNVATMNGVVTEIMGQG